MCRPKRDTPSLLEHSVTVEKLLSREAVFRFLGFANDRVSPAQRARVVAKAHEFGQPRRSLDKWQVADIVNVDESAKLARLLVLFGGRVVRGEDNLVPAHADAFGEHEFRQTRTIRPQPFLAKDRHDMRIGSRFDRKVFLEPRTPGECIVESSGVFPDAALVIDIKRCGVLSQNLFDPCLVEGQGLTRGL